MRPLATLASIGTNDGSRKRSTTSMTSRRCLTAVRASPRLAHGRHAEREVPLLGDVCLLGQGGDSLTRRLVSAPRCLADILYRLPAFR